MPNSTRSVFRARTIVEEARVEQEVSAAESGFARFNDAWQGLKWLLARTPEIGYRIPHPTDDREVFVYVQSAGNLDGVPEIFALYEFDEDQVTFLAISVRPSDS